MVLYFEHDVYVTKMTTDRNRKRQTETGDVAHAFSSGSKESDCFGVWFPELKSSLQCYANGAGYVDRWRPFKC